MWDLYDPRDDDSRDREDPWTRDLGGAEAGTIGTTTAPTILVISSFANSTCRETPGGSSSATRSEIGPTS